MVNDYVVKIYIKMDENFLKSCLCITYLKRFNTNIFLSFIRKGDKLKIF